MLDSYQSLKMPYPPRTVYLPGVHVTPTRGAKFHLSSRCDCSSCLTPKLSASFLESV